MAANNGTLIAAPIVQPTTEDAQNYVTHYAKLGKGGFFSVASIAERNALPAVSREVGMVLSVVADGNWYELKGGIDNANWQVVEFGGGGSEDLQSILENGNITTIPIIVTDTANYSNEIFEGGFRITNLETGFFSELIIKEPVTSGVKFLLPASTTPDDKVLVTHVNQIPANDGGVVFVGLNDVVQQNNILSSSIEIDGFPGELVSFYQNNIDGFRNELLFDNDGPNFWLSSANNDTGVYSVFSMTNGSISFQTTQESILVGVGSGGSGMKYAADYSAGYTNRSLVDKEYVDNAISASGIPTDLSYTASPTNGVVNSSTGADATIPVADTTNAGLLSPADKTKLNNTSNTNTGDDAINTTSNTYADGKVANDMTASNTVAPSKSAVKTYIDNADATKQATLVSGTNIKTFGGSSLLGSGELFPTETGFMYFLSNGTIQWVSSNSANVVLANGSVILRSTMILNQGLQGYTAGTNTQLTSSTTVLDAFRNLQAQINVQATRTGTATLSGNGTSTSFNIAHGLGSVPSFKTAVAGNAASSNISFITADATNITINYAVAPASGTNNLSINWLVK